MRVPLRPLMLHGTNVTELLAERFARLSKTGWVTLLNAPIESYMLVNIEAIRVLTQDLGYQGIYITVNKPYLELAKALTDHKLDLKDLYFVDAISQTFGAHSIESKNCKYVFGPLNIESIAEKTYEFITKMSKSKKVFVFIDSITTILLYNHLPRTIRFSQFLTKDLRKRGVSGVMVSVAASMTSERLINEVSQLCDEVIEISAITQPIR